MSYAFSSLRIFSFILLSLMPHSRPTLMADETDQSELLTVGSEAPALDIEHWISDGGGEFEHVTELATDKVYIIQFWATWCGPSQRSIPHLSEVQAAWKDKGVQLIAVSDEEVDTVRQFLKTKVPDGDGETYGELAENYCVTVDPDGSVYRDYFLAAKQNGIPCAFIVGKQGTIEWFGHPLEGMDEALKNVMAGNWDRDAFRDELKRRREKEDGTYYVKLQQQYTELIEKVDAKLDEKDDAGALALIDKAIEDQELAELKPQLELKRTDVLIYHVGGKRGADALEARVGLLNNDGTELNALAWGIYEKHFKEPVDESILSGALKAARRAVKLESGSGAILDTLAHLLHATGELDEALEVQEKALDYADQNEAELEAFLKVLQAEKAEQAGN